MDLGSRNKVKIEGGMASMTDLVFLLLIFFMLTSTLVTTNALEIQLPKSDATNVKKANVSVTIDEELRFSIDNDIVDAAELEQGILQAVNNNPEAVLIIRADQSVPTGETVRVLDIAYRNQIKVVLATDPN